jgi:Ser/Thr protein kinase RdoA (MazF antagonist)
MQVAPAGRIAEFANHIEPGRALPGTRAGAARIRQWQPTPWERQMAGEAERLAELVAAGETALAPGLPRQLVRGDFWDDNVFFQDETPVFIADFSFMAERARIDDLALALLRRHRIRPGHQPGPDRGAEASGARLRQRA